MGHPVDGSTIVMEQEKVFQGMTSEEIVVIMFDQKHCCVTFHVILPLEGTR